MANCGIHKIVQKPIERKVKVDFRYRIYYVDENGLLKKPTRNQYGRNIEKYDDGLTERDCLEQIEKAGDCMEYVILPVTNTQTVN